MAASPSTWYRLVRQDGWRRPRLREHPAKPKAGLRTTGPDEMWHIDAAVIRLLGGLRAYPLVLAAAGVENANAQVDALIETGVLRERL